MLATAAGASNILSSLFFLTRNLLSMVRFLRPQASKLHLHVLLEDGMSATPCIKIDLVMLAERGIGRFRAETSGGRGKGGLEDSLIRGKKMGGGGVT